MSLESEGVLIPIHELNLTQDSVQSHEQVNLKFLRTPAHIQHVEHAYVDKSKTRVHFPPHSHLHVNSFL